MNVKGLLFVFNHLIRSFEMRPRKQFSAVQYGEVVGDNNVVTLGMSSIVSAVTGTYAKTSRLYKVANKLLKAQQEFNALLAQEGGIINGSTTDTSNGEIVGGGDTGGVGGTVAG